MLRKSVDVITKFYFCPRGLGALSIGTVRARRLFGVWSGDDCVKCYNDVDVCCFFLKMSLNFQATVRTEINNVVSPFVNGFLP